MPGRRLSIQRDANHVFVFAPRTQLTGRQVAQVTDRCRAALAGFHDYRFHPAHDADVFAWVIEFASLRAAGRFFHTVQRSIRGRSV